MKAIRFGRLVSLAVSPFLVSAVQAQAPRGPYYQRVTTPGFAAPRGAARAVSPTPRPIAPALAGGTTMDRLRPYTAGAGARAEGAPLGNVYSSRPRAVSRVARPSPPPARNYFPTARVGQGPNRNVRDHCLPSRGGLIVGPR